MEQSMQDQIVKAIQDHMSRSTPHQMPEFQQMVANQGRQIQLLTRLMMKQISYQDPTPMNETGPTGKRSAEGLTATDNEDEETYTTETTAPSSSEVRKRADITSNNRGHTCCFLRAKFNVVFSTKYKCPNAISQTVDTRLGQHNVPGSSQSPIASRRRRSERQ
jgi:hypothetical protein